MTAQEQTILDSLKALEATVNAMSKTKSRPNLLPLFARLDELTNGLPADTEPQLLHYLHKKSYEKARLWLEDQRGEIARGGCLGD